MGAYFIFLPPCLELTFLFQMKGTCLLILLVCWSMGGSEAYPTDGDGMMRMIRRVLAVDHGQAGDEHDENDDDKDEYRFIW